MVDGSTPLNTVEKKIININIINMGAVSLPSMVDNLSGLKAINTDNEKNTIE
jgi:hypothetical protein